MVQEEPPVAHNELALAQAVYVAQNTTGDIHKRTARFLEKSLLDVRTRLQAEPDSCVLSSAEFALINYYKPALGADEVVERATARFWNMHGR